MSKCIGRWGGRPHQQQALGSPAGSLPLRPPPPAGGRSRPAGPLLGGALALPSATVLRSGQAECLRREKQGLWLGGGMHRGIAAAPTLSNASSFRAPCKFRIELR